MKNNLTTKRKRIGEILVSQGRITPEKLAEFLRIQKKTNKRLGEILIEHGILTKDELSTGLGEQLGIPHVWLRKGMVDPRIVEILPKEKALHYQVIPMFKVGDTLTLATSDPYAIFIFDEVAKITGLKVQPVICRTDDILESISKYYDESISVVLDDIINDICEDDIDVVEGVAERDVKEIAELAEGSPVINLVNKILLKSIRDGASDIHIEPTRKQFRVRVRIDGVMYELMTGNVDMHPPLVSRLKVMSNLDIAERRIPQDGRIQVAADGKNIDVRFSSMPTIYGEKIVLRILDKNKALLDVNKLGFAPETLEGFKGALFKPHGLIVVCGPTGSGKTTTLYSALALLNTPEKNIVTIEDPVEYQLEMINQIQTNEGIGLTFAKILKHTLRQDPDIIMVGEIRDKETAETAIQASLTGHLVLTTLHTNDSPSAVTRLLEMGVEPYLVSSAMLACLAQRLVRTICPNCKTAYYPPSDVLKKLGTNGNKKTTLKKGKGCSDCYDSGYKGRIGLYELLDFDEDIQSLILKSPTSDQIKKTLSEKGYKDLQMLGYDKVLKGVTTLEEVTRATIV
jgi:type IV pilus assembly protein PilB